MSKFTDQLTLRLLLQLSMPPLNKAARRSARFRELLEEPPFVFQVATRSGAAGFYELKEKRLRVGLGRHLAPDLTQTWQDGQEARRVLMNPDQTEILRAVEDGRCKLRGSFEVALWFNEAMKIARTKPESKPDARTKMHSRTNGVRFAGMFSLIRFMLASRLRRQPRKGAAPEGGFVDVHAHYLPDFYVAAMRQAGVTDVDGMPIPQWSVDQAIEMMDGSNISVQILSISSPGLTFAAGEEACKLARNLNDFAADLIKDHPSRFRAFAVLPLPDVEASLAEIAYALDTLNFSGVGMLSNYNGVYLGEPVFDRIFAELHRRKAIVFVHPTRPPNFKALSVGLPAPLIEYPFDSTRMAANLIRSGTLDRFPEIKLIVAHGGGTIPYLYPRLLAGLGARGAKLFPSFHYDLTATTMPGQTQLLRDVVDADKFLMGFDFPFMDPSTAKPMTAGLHLGNFSRRHMRGIQRDNAHRLFSGGALDSNLHR